MDVLRNLGRAGALAATELCKLDNTLKPRLRDSGAQLHHTQTVTTMDHENNALVLLYSCNATTIGRGRFRVWLCVGISG